MQFSIVQLSDVKADNELFRIDAEYWHPEFIKNSLFVSGKNRIFDFVKKCIKNINSSPTNRDFQYLEISKISLSGNNYQTTKVECGNEPDRAYYILHKTDVVVSTVRPNRNAVAFIEEDGIVGSSGLCVLRAENIESEYLLAFCKTDYFIKSLMRANKASMYPVVSNENILETHFFETPTLRAYVVPIIKLVFSKRQKSEQFYSQAEQLLLTEFGLNNWHPKHQLTFIKNCSDTIQAERIDAECFQPKYNDIINAIKAYKGGWDALGNLVDVKKSVEVGGDEYLDEGIPFIRVSNISLFEISEEKYISEQLYTKLTPNEQDVSFIKSKNHQPQQGEILFSKDGSPGIAYHLKDSPQKMIVSGGILRLKSKTNKVSNEYLTLVLNSVLTQEQVKRDVGGSIILHWRPDQVKETTIPILSEDKQQEIQQKVTESFNLRKQSKHLLECAKKAVEIAIEQDEKTATNWLENETNEMQI